MACQAERLSFDIPNPGWSCQGQSIAWRAFSSVSRLMRRIRHNRNLIPGRLPQQVLHSLQPKELLGPDFAFDPETEDPVRQAPVFRLSRAPAA